MKKVIYGFLAVAAILAVVLFVVSIPTHERKVLGSLMVSAVNGARRDATQPVLVENEFLRHRADDLQGTVPDFVSTGVKYEHATSAEGFDQYLAEVYVVAANAQNAVTQLFKSATTTKVLLAPGYDAIGASGVQISDKLYSFVIVMNVLPDWQPGDNINQP